MKWITIILIVIIILMATDKFFEENNGLPDGQSFYPPSVDFKAAVEETVDEILSDKIFDFMWKNFYWNDLFDNVDGWTIDDNAGVSNVDIGNGGVLLETLAVSNNPVSISN